MTENEYNNRRTFTVEISMQGKKGLHLILEDYHVRKNTRAQRSLSFFMKK